MKRIHRLIAILAALALLCGITPLSTTAAPFPVITHLSSVSITVDAPRAGRLADFTLYPSSSPTHGARAYVEQKDYQNMYHGVSWYDKTDERYLAEGEAFVFGHDYRLRVYVIVNNPAYYYFTDDVTATVNGNNASVNYINSFRFTASYDFSDCEKAPDDITNVTLGGSLYPVAGQSPVFEVAIDEERMQRDPYAGGAFINGVAWYNSNTWHILGENDVFIEGEEYTMLVQLKAINEYRFATQNGESTVDITINGFEAENISSQTDQPDLYLKASCTFTCVSADSVGGGADDVKLYIDYPVGGHTASRDVEIYGDNCKLTYFSNNEKGIFDSVKWYNRDSGYILNQSGRFTTDLLYSVSVVVNAESVLHDENRLCYIDKGDGTYLPYMRAYINGLPARVEPYDSDTNVAQTVLVTVDFPACNDTSFTVNDITLTDIQTPVVDDIPDSIVTVTYGYEEDLPSSSFEAELTWIEFGETQSTRIMEETDVFSQGHFYYAVLVLNADPLSSFAVNDVNKSFGGNVSARGSVQTISEWMPTVGKNLIVAAVYAPLTELPDPIDSIDIIGSIAPTVGGRPNLTAALSESDMPYAQITNVDWFVNGDPMAPDATFEANKEYYVVYTVTPEYPYSFLTNGSSLNVLATVNGNSKPYDSTSRTGVSVAGDAQSITVKRFYGKLTASSASSVTDYIEISDVMRPAPGQTPDFNAVIDSAYTQFGGITWCELDENGYTVDTLTYHDTFKHNTAYRAEIRILPTEGRAINLDQRGATLNGDTCLYYYLSGEAVTVYAVYDTADCIDTVEIADLQYPIPGKTPDTNICFSQNDDRLSIEPYTDNSDIEWYYETNPGTSAAGFAKLDGKFKSDRRHQAYVQLEANDGYWFATDKDGKLTVDVTFDTVPMTFAYSTDAYYSNDGAVNTIEIARTFELANTVDGVFIDGMALTDGLYLDTDHWGIQTEDTVDKDAGYAYYQDGVLTLHNFSWDACGDYNAIDSYKPLTIRAEGTSSLTSVAIGLSSTNTLILTGDGQLNLYGDSYGMFTMGDITVENGTWIVKSETDYGTGLWLYDSLTVNNGTLDIYGADIGLYGDDYPPVNVNGGTLIARADRDYAIAWCDVSTANGAKTTVGMNTDGSGAALWDGTTAFIDCSYVKITFESDILLGDYDQNGIINMRDVMQLYKDFSVGKAMTDYQKAAGDYDQNGTINMRDVLSLYKFISGK